MSNLLKTPLQDGFATRLAQEWDGNTGTMFLQKSPEFTFPSGETTYMVVQPNGLNPKLIEIDSYNNTNNTVNIINVTLLRGAGINNPTGITYPTNTEVIISDNYQFWEDIKNAIATKLNLDETSTIANSIKIQFGTADAYIYTDDNGVNLKFKDQNNAEATLSDILAQGGADRKVAVSDNDTTPGQLNDKIIGLDGISTSIVNPIGNESLGIEVDINETNGLIINSGQLDIQRSTDSIIGATKLANIDEANDLTNNTTSVTPMQLYLDSIEASDSIRVESLSQAEIVVSDVPSSTPFETAKSFEIKGFPQGGTLRVTGDVFVVNNSDIDFGYNINNTISGNVDIINNVPANTLTPFTQDIPVNNNDSIILGFQSTTINGITCRLSNVRLRYDYTSSGRGTPFTIE